MLTIKAVRIWRGKNRGRFGWVAYTESTLYQSAGTFATEAGAEADAAATAPTLQA